MTRRARHTGDRGGLTVALMLVLVVALGGAGLIVDGGRAMVARRHATNTAEGAARAAIATWSPGRPFDAAAARRAAMAHAQRAGIAARDVRVQVGAGQVTVVVTARRRTVFLVLGGVSQMTVRGRGSARIVYST